MKLIFDKFSNLFERAAFESDGEDELRRAIAVLIVHASAIDGDVDEREMVRRDEILKNKFDLSDNELAEVIADATRQDNEATDLYKFTSVLTKHLDQDGRKDVIKMLWEIVLADGRIDAYESNLVWRLAELIGVSTRDRVNLRQQVEAGLTGRAGG
ncbi:MAG: TerB family tellurite resistance protein [Hyphomicrobiales bacterium]